MKQSNRKKANKKRAGERERERTNEDGAKMEREQINNKEKEIEWMCV